MSGASSNNLAIARALRVQEVKRNPKHVLIAVGKGLDTEGGVSCFTRAVVEQVAKLDRENAGMYSSVIFPAEGGFGSGKVYPKTEALVMMEYALSLGMNPAKAVLETKAMDTLTTFYYVDPIISNMANVGAITTVATDYHMPRVQFITEKFFGGRYDLTFVPANTHLSTGNESRLIMDDEKMRLERETKQYGTIRNGDNVAMSERMRSMHGHFRTKVKN